jgi:hypothetical protein
MELHSQHGFSWGAAFWAFWAAVSLVGGLVLGNSHLLILSVAPSALALGLWFVRPPEFHATLTDRGLEFEDASVTIPYAAMESVTMRGRAQDPDSPRLRAGPLMIVYHGGAVEVPARLNVSVKEIYRAILAQMPLTGSRAANPELAGHDQKEVETFGAERVHVFAHRRHSERRPSTRRGQVCSGLLLLCGIFWVSIGLFAADKGKPLEYDHWIGWGVALSILSVVSWLVLNLRQRSVAKIASKLKNAELVISPTGIALMQGDLKGHLRWDELRDARLRVGGWQIVVDREQTADGIDLTISGARIRLADVYDRPLPVIHGLIRRYWKGE